MNTSSQKLNVSQHAVRAVKCNERVLVEGQVQVYGTSKMMKRFKDRWI